MNVSLIAGLAVLLGMLIFEQGNLAARASASATAFDAARRAIEAGSLLTILSLPWVVISTLFID